MQDSWLPLDLRSVGLLSRTHSSRLAALSCRRSGRVGERGPYWLRFSGRRIHWGLLSPALSSLGGRRGRSRRVSCVSFSNSTAVLPVPLPLKGGEGAEGGRGSGSTVQSANPFGAFSPRCRLAAGTALRWRWERASPGQLRCESGVAPVYLWTISGKPLVNLWYIPPVSSSCHGAVEGLKRMGWRAANLRARQKVELAWAGWTSLAWPQGAVPNPVGVTSS